MLYDFCFRINAAVYSLLRSGDNIDTALTENLAIGKVIGGYLDCGLMTGVRPA